MSKKKIMLFALITAVLIAFINIYIYISHSSLSFYSTNTIDNNNDKNELDLQSGKSFDNVKQNENLEISKDNSLDIDDGTIKLSGIQWCEKYKGSNDINDLKASFREKVLKFTETLKKSGVKVEILTTLRTEQSCYLYHYAWLISQRQINPEDVPLRDDVRINWCHSTLNKSITAAKDMISKWDISYEPALNSNHIGGTAVDMLISWKASKKNPIKIEDADGTYHTVIFPKSVTDPSTDTLDIIADSYGIYNLKGDKNHWSSMGN
ncbi:MAG: hypothetical protein ABF289_02980 [Clostridiales bacterium]